MLKVSRQEPIGLYCQTGESLFTFRRFFYSSFVAYTEVESIQKESSKLQLHAVLHFWNVSFFSYICRLRKKVCVTKENHRCDKRHPNGSSNIWLLSKNCQRFHSES